MANDKHLYELDELTTPQSNDLVMVEKSSNNKDMKVKLSNLISNDIIEAEVDAWLDDHPEATTTVEDGSITPAKLHQDTLDMFDEKANTDGYYDEMSVGSAEQLLSNTYIPDTDPYLFRTSGGSLEIGDRVYEDAIVGGSVAWNQKLNANDFSTIAWDVQQGAVKNNVSADNVLDISFGTSSMSQLIRSITLTNGHKFLSTVDIKLPNASDSLQLLGGAQTTIKSTSATTDWQTVATIWGNTTYSYWILRNASGIAINNALVKNAMVIDLTLMFGSTIADYIYTLETSEAGSGIAWLKSYGFFTKDYYPYNAGGIQSVKTSAKKVVGFNQWDKNGTIYNGYLFDDGTFNGNADYRTTDYIRAIPNTSYYFKGTGGTNPAICWYDYDKTFISGTKNNSNLNRLLTTPQNAYYIRASFPAQNIDTFCINLHWDGERDGEYEAYTEHTYPLDSDLELRGIPKLDSSNKLYYDGDIYASDGTVTRRYGIVDLGTLNWTNSSYGAGYWYATLNDLKINNYTISQTDGLICAKYEIKDWSSDKTLCKFAQRSDTKLIRLHDDTFDGYTQQQVQTALSGVYLVYEKETPTTESADPYTNPQIVSNWGTEEFVDERTVPVPVRHNSRYLPDLKAKLESAPNNPDANGKYFLQYENGQATYVPVPSEVPQTPSEDGTYILKATVASGTATLAWVSEE